MPVRLVLANLQKGKRRSQYFLTYCLWPRLAWPSIPHRSRRARSREFRGVKLEICQWAMHDSRFVPTGIPLAGFGSRMALATSAVTVPVSGSHQPRGPSTFAKRPRTSSCPACDYSVIIRPPPRFLPHFIERRNRRSCASPNFVSPARPARERFAPSRWQTTVPRTTVGMLWIHAQ